MSIAHERECPRAPGKATARPSPKDRISRPSWLPTLARKVRNSPSLTVRVGVGTELMKQFGRPHEVNEENATVVGSVIGGTVAVKAPVKRSVSKPRATDESAADERLVRRDTRFMTQLPKRYLSTFVLLVVVSVAASGALFIPPASASTSRFFEQVDGVVTDPGPVISDVVPAGDLVRFRMTGGSVWSGDLDGTTTYKGPGVFDPATGESRTYLREVFTGTFGQLSGTLRCVEILTEHADGSGQVDLVVVGGSGDLARIHGYIRFTWTAPTTSTTIGEYHGLLMR